MTAVLHGEMTRRSYIRKRVRAQMRDLVGVSNAKCWMTHMGEHAMAALISPVACLILTLDEFTMLFQLICKDTCRFHRNLNEKLNLEIFDIV